MKISKKNPDEIVFRGKGGELICWKHVGSKKINTNVFIEFKLCQEKGLLWVMLGDKGPIEVQGHLVDLYDVLD